MSLDPGKVASVVRQAPDGIDFVVDTVTVNRQQMETVAKAIDGGDIALEVAASGGFGASWQSWMGRAWKDGEKKLKGTIRLGSESVVASPVGKAGIYHESVHAMISINTVNASELHDEMAAYLADAMYLTLTKTSFKADKLAQDIYDAAFAVIAAKGLLRKKGVKLTWKDCDGLRQAIHAYPEYSQLKE